MSATIQPRRGPESTIPVLADGEVAITTDTHRAFVGTSSGNVDVTSAYTLLGDTTPAPLSESGSGVAGTSALAARADHRHPLIVNADVDTTAGIVLSKLGQSGAASGQAPVWSGTAWVPSTVVGGGTGTYNARDYGLLGDGSTDDTAAFRTLIATVVAAGGGTILMPDGIYNFAGALQNHPNGSTPGLINLPAVAINSSTATVPLTIEGETAARPPIALFFNLPAPTGGTILRCTTAASTSGGSSVNGRFFNAGAGAWTNLAVTFRNLTIRLPNQTTWHGIDAGRLYGLDCENVVIDVNCGDTTIAQPPAPTYGIVTPYNANGAKTRLRNVGAAGYGAGYLLCEHTDADDLWAFKCTAGYDIAPADHSIWFGRMLAVWCAAPLRTGTPTDQPAPSGTGGVQIRGELFDIEDAAAGSWYSPGSYHINDSGNFLRGQIWYARVVSGVGKSLTSLTTNGCANLTLSLVEAQTVAGGAADYQHNDALVASEAALDFEDSATVTFTLTDDSGNGRMKVSADTSGGTGTRLAIQSGSSAPPIALWTTDGEDFCYLSAGAP